MAESAADDAKAETAPVARRRFRCLRFLIKWGLVAAVGYVLIYALLGLPSAAQLDMMLRHPLLEVRFDGDGTVAETVCHGCGIYLRPEDIPERVKQAAIAVEDQWFYIHPGVNPITYGAAAWRYVASGFRSRVGGSTITQQLVKFRVLNPSQTVWRKLLELPVALKLEIHFSKEEILAAYLNTVYFGTWKGLQVHGIELAAQKYFGKRAKQLNLFEIAVLIGSLKAPGEYNFQVDRAAATERATIVLERMIECGYITRADADKALRGGAEPGTKQPVRVTAIDFRAWAVAEMRAVMPEHAGGSVWLVTTLDPNQQIYAELAIDRHLDLGARRMVSQGALVAMTPDGAVSALVGGRHRGNDAFDRATQARRQPASAFKPFVFLAAFERGFTPATPILDRPLKDGWPDNYDNRYHGRVSLEEALSRSYNAATVQLAQQVGHAAIIDLARRLGLASKLPDVASLPLGVGEVTPLELVGAYAVFANDGFAVAPFAIHGARDDDGVILYWRRPAVPKRLVEAKPLAMLNQVLAKVMSADAVGDTAAFPVPESCGTARGKTGTSQNFRDAWFIGYSDCLVAGVWFGNDDGTRMRGVYGSDLPALAWRNFMAGAHADIAERN